MKILRHYIKSTVFILVSSFFLLGGCYSSKLYAQENKAIKVSLIPEIGFNFSYFHLTSKSYRKNFRITTGLGASKSFYWGLGLQLGLWNQWKATLSLSQTYIGGRQNYNYAGFPNLPQGQRFSKEKAALSFPTNMATLTFAKKIWWFRMGAIKGVSLASELDVLFGAGVMWFSKNSKEEREQWSSGEASNDNTWLVDNLVEFVATPTNYHVGILDVGFTYHLYINSKARFVFGAKYSYGLRASYFVAYKSTYYYDNHINNFHDSSVENFKAETGRHQFTLFIGYPIALYRNKAEKKLLKEDE